MKKKHVLPIKKTQIISMKLIGVICCILLVFFNINISKMVNNTSYITPLRPSGMGGNTVYQR
jgi:hypothetical protein